jgi:Xaa-Pro aminopeptidase
MIPSVVIKEFNMKARVNEMVNLPRLWEQMDMRGVDAIVARAGINFTYLSGLVYPGTLARHVDLADSPRAVYLIWPRNGEPRIVTNATAEGLARRDSWVEHFDVYEGYVEPPVERLAKVLGEMGLGKAKVAFEANYMSMADWTVLEKALPGMSMVDSLALMEHVRAVKMPAEIALFRRGADILDDAFLVAFKQAKAGMRERDLHGILLDECTRNGAGFTHGILNSSRNTIPYAGESDFVFQTGDVIRTDYVAFVDGYPGHQSRCAIIGEPTARQREEYATQRDLYRTCCAYLKPGITAGEVYQFVVDQYAAAGMKYHSILAGHGVGNWWHQQEPVISRGNPRVLEEGMVIAMEPHIDHWHIQDMFVIRESGPELLSPKFNTDEIFVCA